MILDSSERREFETGAVRDIVEGKGRMDLIPFDIMLTYMSHSGIDPLAVDILEKIGQFLCDHDSNHLYTVIGLYSKWRYDRDDLTMLLDIAKHYEEGAKKYGEYNWTKGIPTHCYLDSALRHFVKLLRGDSDENHDRAFVWNIIGLIWTILHKPELDDIYYLEKTVIIGNKGLDFDWFYDLRGGLQLGD